MTAGIDLTGEAGVEIQGAVLVLCVVAGALVRPRWLAWLIPTAVGVYFLVFTLREAGVLAGGSPERTVGLGILAIAVSVLVTSAGVFVGRALARGTQALARRWRGQHGP